MFEINFMQHSLVVECVSPGHIRMAVFVYILLHLENVIFPKGYHNAILLRS